MFGFTDFIKPATPATKGVAAEHPRNEPKDVLELEKLTVRRTEPGATKSSAAPVPEELARLLMELVDPIDMVNGDAPGWDTFALPIPPLPAQAIKITPLSLAAWRASFSALELE